MPDIRPLGRPTYQTPDMLKLYNINQNSLILRVKDGAIPKPVRVGLRNYWDAALVDNHLNKLFENAANAQAAA